MNKTFKIIKTTDSNFIDEVIDLNLVQLLMSLQIQIKEQKFYLHEIIFRANILILKSGSYEIEIQEVL